MFYFGMKLKLPGIMVTASHNRRILMDESRRSYRRGDQWSELNGSVRNRAALATGGFGTFLTGGYLKPYADFEKQN